MDDNHVIEIAGCKISPEFIDLVTLKLLPTGLDAAVFADCLFDVQTSMLIAIAGSNDIPTNLSQMAFAIHSLKYFMDELGELRKQGKF